MGNSWFWTVLGLVVFPFLGTGVAFMTSGHPLIADFFFLVSGLLFLFKFVTWDEVTPVLGNRKLGAISLAAFATAVLIGGAIWGNHYLNRAVTNYSAVFVRELDRPLRAIYAICTMDREMDINELGRFGFLVELHDLANNSNRGIYIASFYSMERNPEAIGRPGPPLVAPGMDSALWTSPPFRRVTGTRVFEFTTLNRLEAGGGYRNPQMPMSIGDLDNWLIQVFITPEIVGSVKKVSLIANDFVIYEAEKRDFNWPRVTRMSEDDRRSLPAQAQLLKWEPIALAKYTLNFKDLNPSLHVIPSSYEDVAAVGRMLGKGWLPEKR